MSTMKRKKKAKIPPPSLAIKRVKPITAVREAIAEVRKRKPVRPLTAALVPPENMETETPTLAYLRYSAGITYTANMDGLTVQDLAAMPMFKDVGLSRLQYWRSKDKWDERRREILERWREQLERKVGSEIIQARITDMKRLEGLYCKALTKLEGDYIPANSWEGMAGAAVKLSKTLDDMRQRIGADLLPQTGIAGGSGSALALPQAKFEAEEIRAAAMTIIESRRAKIRDEAAKLNVKALDEPQSQDQGADVQKVDKNRGSSTP